LSADSLAFAGILALSGELAAGAYWARPDASRRRMALVVALWILGSVSLWQLIVSHLDWAPTYLAEILTFHGIASGVPAAVAFALARRGLAPSWSHVLRAITLIVLLWIVLAFPLAMLAGCMLDSHCDP
jgi:hypothetical protein